MKYSLACICGYETPHVENKKDVDTDLIDIHQEFCEVYINDLKKNPNCIDTYTQEHTPIIKGKCFKCKNDIEYTDLSYFCPICLTHQ